MADIIVIQEPITQIIVEAGEPEVVLIESGPPGPIGPVGPQGPDGVTSWYSYVQTAPSSDWIVDHNLGKLVNVSVVIGGSVVDADIIHNSLNQTTIHFSSPQTGEVVFS